MPSRPRRAGHAAVPCHLRPLLPYCRRLLRAVQRAQGLGRVFNTHVHGALLLGDTDQVSYWAGARRRTAAQAARAAHSTRARPCQPLPCPANPAPKQAQQNSMGLCLQHGADRGGLLDPRWDGVSLVAARRAVGEQQEQRNSAARQAAVGSAVKRNACGTAPPLQASSPRAAAWQITTNVTAASRVSWQGARQPLAASKPCCAAPTHTVTGALLAFVCTLDVSGGGVACCVGLGAEQQAPTLRPPPPPPADRDSAAGTRDALACVARYKSCITVPAIIWAVGWLFLVLSWLPCTYFCW